jgi:hypothetical protein
MPRDRKELLPALLEEVIVKVERDKAAAHLTLRWKGGALGEIDLALPRSRPATIRTAEDTVALVRRLAVALLARIPLGPRPSLHRLRSGLLRLVRRLPRYYGGV